MITDEIQAETNLPLTRPLEGRKIVIVVENLPVPFDRRVWQEATTLASAGAKVSIISPKAGEFQLSRELIDGVQIYRHPMPKERPSKAAYLVEYGSSLFFQTLLTFKIAIRNGIDVIHGCNPPDLVFLVALLFKPFGVKYVFDHHDINPELFEAKFDRKGFFWRLLVIAEYLTFKTANIVISTNQSYRLIAIKRGKKKSQDVFIVRSGPDLKKMRLMPANSALKKGRAFLVGYVGVIGEQEGIDLLLKAVQFIIKDLGRRDIHFCIVGGGPSLKAMQDLCTQMKLDEFVTFTGRVSNEAMLEALSTADICVNPDRVNDMNDKSTMNKILEYMALGKPIVQFDVTEGRYSAQGASLYAQPNDAVDFAKKMAELIDDLPLRETMGALGRKRVVESLSWEFESKKLVAAYEHLFGLK
jgi:glycosyltransferase involved in cell wall biosynthesis